MKTSNKILIGLVITVFAVPLLLAATLKSKMNKGVYTVEKNHSPGNWGNVRKGTFTAFKVVKVIAPRAEMLVCNLQQSDKMDFTYYNDGSSDSLAVYTQNDTLYIQYLAQPENEDQQGQRGFGKIVANINLPMFNRLIVDGAVVVMQSSLTNTDSLSISLKNKAVIQEGGSNADENIPPMPVQEEKVIEKEVSRVSLDEVESEEGRLDVLKNASVQLIDFSVKDVLINHLIRM